METAEQKVKQNIRHLSISTGISVLLIATLALVTALTGSNIISVIFEKQIFLPANSLLFGIVAIAATALVFNTRYSLASAILGVITGSISLVYMLHLSDLMPINAIDETKGVFALKKQQLLAHFALLMFSAGFVLAHFKGLSRGLYTLAVFIGFNIGLISLLDLIVSLKDIFPLSNSIKLPYFLSLCIVSLGISIFSNEERNPILNLDIEDREGSRLYYRLFVVVVFFYPSVIGSFTMLLKTSNLINGLQCMKLFFLMYSAASLSTLLTVLEKVSSLKSAERSQLENFRHLNFQLAESREELMASNDQLKNLNLRLVDTNKSLESTNFKLQDALAKLKDETTKNDKLMNELLVVTRSQADNMFENVPVAMWIYDKETLNILEVNATACAQYGYSYDEFTRLSILDIRPKSEHNHLKFLVKTRPDGINRLNNIKHMKKNGEIIYAHITSWPYQFNGRDGIMVYAVDLTDQILLNKRYQDLTEKTDDVVIEFDDQDRITYVNTSLIKLTGLPSEYFIDKAFDEIFKVDKSSQSFQAYQRVKTEGKAQTVTDHLFNMDGNSKNWYELMIYPTSGGIATITRNVSERVMYELELADKERKYFALFENSYQLTFVLDPWGRITQANKKAIDYLNVSNSSFENETYIYELEWLKLSPSASDSLKAMVNDAKQGRKQQAKRIEVLAPDGRLLIFNTGIRAVYDEKNILSFLVLEAQDITEIESINQRFRESEATLRQMSHSLPNGIIMLFNKAGQCTFADGQDLDFFGLKPFIRQEKSLDEISPRFNNEQRATLANSIVNALGSSGQSSQFRLELDDRFYECYTEPVTISGSEQSFAMVIYMNITEILRTKAVLKEQSDFTNNLLDLLPNYLFVYDIVGQKLTYLNPNLRTSLGISEAVTSLSRADALSIIHPEDLGTAFPDVETFREVSKTSNLVRTQFRIKGRSGEYRWVTLLARTIKSDLLGIPIQLLGVMVDVNDLKIYEQELRLAKAVAEEANIAKTNFLANMSHEIRNPINAMLGIGQLLEKNFGQDEKISFYTNLLMQSGNRLLNTIGEVLDMSRIESGAVKIEMVRVNVSKMLEESRTNWETLAGKKNIAFEMKMPNTLVQADLDTNLIQQVLNNLIGNSIKFTDQGKIAVSLNYFKQPNSEKGILKINITDTGIGMNKDFVENKLFKAFEQESRGYNRKYEGSGLGLFLCKKFTELMNGTIEVDSKQGTGTTFTLNFPAY